MCMLRFWQYLDFLRKPPLFPFVVLLQVWQPSMLTTVPTSFLSQYVVLNVDLFDLGLTNMLTLVDQVYWSWYPPWPRSLVMLTKLGLPGLSKPILSPVSFAPSFFFSSLTQSPSWLTHLHYCLYSKIVHPSSMPPSSLSIIRSAIPLGDTIQHPLSISTDVSPSSSTLAWCHPFFSQLFNPESQGIQKYLECWKSPAWSPCID